MKIPRPDGHGGENGEEGQDGDEGTREGVPLPTTLVRIPLGEEEKEVGGSGEDGEGGT